MEAAALNSTTVCKLRQLETARAYLRQLDEAITLLSPADKLIYQKLILHPEKGNVDVLIELLELERPTLYRRREKLLQHLAPLLPPP